jgi:MFS family permease
VRCRRPVAACAIPAFFVAVLVVAGPLASRHSASAADGPAHHAIVAGEAPISPAAVSSLDHSRRGSTFAALVAYLAVALSIALAFLLRIRGGIASWALLPGTDRTRRDRAPPFAHA